MQGAFMERHEFTDIGHCRDACGPHRGQSFELRTQIADLVVSLRGQSRDHDSVAMIELQRLFGRKPRQRLAHRRRAYPKL
jgi:hypothetical protein